MIAGTYQAYPVYKESGVEWLGEIPVYWKARQLKFLCTYNDDVISESLDSEFEIEYIDIGSVSAIDGTIKTEIMPFAKAPSRARRIVQDGDVIISTVRTYLKAIVPINCPSDNLVVSTGFTVIRPNNYLYKGYAAYCLRENGFIGEVVSRSVGVSYPAINASDLVNINIPEPVYDEQMAIANFLDHETAKIDTLIEKQKTLIKLLKEKRQAVISHAVTKGLNPDAPMKDSGVEWIGKIPVHFKLMRLRNLGMCQNGINIGSEYFGSGYPFVSYGDVYNNRVLPKEVSGLVKSSNEDRENYSVHEGDILFTRTSETVGEIGFASTCLKTIDQSSFAGFLIRFRPFKNNLATGFSKYYFGNILLRAFFVREMNLVTRASLSQDLLKRLPIILPPLGEQRLIGKYLDGKTGIYRKLIQNAEKQTDLLKERRTALISAAVTGKIDVRNWQPPTPDIQSNQKEASQWLH